LNIPVLSLLPLWAYFLTIAALSILCTDIGLRLGKKKKATIVDVKIEDSHVGGIAGGLLSLVSFLLAVSFGTAMSQFDERTRFVALESNLVSKAYNHGEMLTEPARGEFQGLLRDYVRLRGISGDGLKREDLQKIIIESERLHRLMLECERKLVLAGASQAGAIGQDVDSIIDAHRDRAAAVMQSRIPEAIRLLFLILMCMGLIVLGYNVGISIGRHSKLLPLFILAYVLVVYCIEDLERPREGMFRVNPQPMIDLKDKLIPAPAVENFVKE
jgi:hypothetical protein